MPTPSHRQELIADIRRACIEINPEIVELKFGALVSDNSNDTCVILHNESGNLIAYAWTGDIHSFPLAMESLSDEEKKRYRIKRFSQNEEGAYDDIHEIIGRYLTFADILEVIDDHSIVIEAGTGQFGEVADEGVYIGNFPIWNLRLPFEEQSDEVLLFIHGLVK